MILTYRYRVKDKHAAELSRQAAAVNFVWNYCNETQQKAAQAGRRWLSAFDLKKLTAGAGPELGLSWGTVEQVCRQYADSRRRHNRPWLRWRSKTALGWVPFRDECVVFKTGRFRFAKQDYSVWLDRAPPSPIRSGSFSEDSRGRWYLNVAVDVAETKTKANAAVGIDLGLKTLATMSDGSAIAMPAFFRRSEQRIGRAQRAGKKRVARAAHAKIANQRRDYLHKASTKLVRGNALIAIGNVSPSKLAKTRMAKSVLDAGWSDFRRMIAYKAVKHGANYVEVSEKDTTRTCSDCGAISGPQGIAGCGIRRWTCGDCGTVHCRDHNAARNIARLGRQALAEGAATSGDVMAGRMVRPSRQARQGSASWWRPHSTGQA